MCALSTAFPTENVYGVSTHIVALEFIYQKFISSRHLSLHPKLLVAAVAMCVVVVVEVEVDLVQMQVVLAVFEELMAPLAQIHQNL